MAAKKTPASLTKSVFGKIKGLFYSKNSRLSNAPLGTPRNFLKSIEHKILGDFFTIVSLTLIAIVFIIIGIIFFQFMLIIINKGAYITPYDDSLNFLGSGGLFDCAGAGSQINPPNSTLQLLPDSVGPRPLHICFKPTEIVIHWSGGWNGVTGTYNTLVARNLACHFATDESTTLQMLGLWDTMVELSWCQGSSNPDHNYSGIGIEMSGLCFSKSMDKDCGYGTIITPPPPEEFNRTVELACWLKKQYQINTIMGHYQIAAKDDPGVEFLQNTFIPAVNQRCP